MILKLLTALAIVAASSSIYLPGALAQSTGLSSPAEDFRALSRTSKNYRENTRDILALPVWHQYLSIIWPIYYGTNDVTILSEDTISCPRCNLNKVADAIFRVRESCEGSRGVSEPAPITTASLSLDEKTKKPVLKDTFWLRFAYRCKTNPLAINSAFHQESRLTITKISNPNMQNLVGQRCTFYSDSRGYRVDLSGNVISMPWDPERSSVSTKEFVDVPHRDEFWYRPTGRVLTQAIKLSDLFISADQLYIEKPFVYSNALPETLDYIYVRSAQGEFMRIDFEQNAIVSLNSYLPQSNTFFQCDLAIGKNDFNGITKFKRID